MTFIFNFPTRISLRDHKLEVWQKQAQNRQTNKWINNTTLQLKRQVVITAYQHFLLEITVRLHQLTPHWKLSALADNWSWYCIYNASNIWYRNHTSYEPQRQNCGHNELFCKSIFNLYIIINRFITPCKAIEIHVVCGNIEDFDDFQIQHNSFHHHPSKSNEI